MSVLSVPVTLFSGKPRNGKTYSVVEMLYKLWKEGESQIYTYNISGLKIPHTPIADPLKWHECPVGSVIVIDECQGVFPKRNSASHIPEHVAAIATLGHRGHRLILITQSPRNIDEFVREMVQDHTHVERINGGKAWQTFRWQTCQLTTDNKATRKKAEKTLRLGYHEEVYSLYTSSQEHNVKFRMPKYLPYIALAIFIVIAFWKLGYAFMHKGIQTEQGASVPVSDKPVQLGALPDASGSPIPERHTKTALEWYQERVPRLNGMPHTAPAYDSVTAPTVAPKPVACVMTPKRCSCYSQQGTKLPTVDNKACIEIAQNGYFDDSPPRQDPYQAAEMRNAAKQDDAQDKPQAFNIQDGTGDSKKWPMGQKQTSSPPAKS